uniref:Immunoglobulin subtype domain-containing protein n=1 Tax=Sander lucioperca TaxID=283035 RepID=A0A8D0A7G1_SANLU
VALNTIEEERGGGKSSAVTPVFVQKGEDVLLNVTTADVLEDFIYYLLLFIYFLEWKFNNKKEFLIRFLPGRDPLFSDDYYKERIEFSVKKYSMKLKNLQEVDSGVYTARVIGDPVSPVNLSVDSVSNSSDWCNLTVSCRAQDSHINSTFRCDTHNCSQEGGERPQVTPSAADLHVYLSKGSIICNHSNQVSWNKDIEIIEHVCHAGKTERLNHKQLIIIPATDSFVTFGWFSDNCVTVSWCRVVIKRPVQVLLFSANNFCIQGEHPSSLPVYHRSL